MVETKIVIPARLHSTRLYQKMLIKVRGKSILQWTYDRALQITQNVCVVTENQEILDEVDKFKGNCFMQTFPVTCGTEAIRNYCQIMTDPSPQLRIVNLQGDNPCFDIDLMKEIIEKGEYLQNSNSIITGYYTGLASAYTSDNFVKCYIPRKGRKKILYFSRCPIPYKENILNIHIGIYNYPSTLLCKQKTFIRNSESLEQFNFLDKGVKFIPVLGKNTISIDVQSDIPLFERWLDENNIS